MAAAAGVDIATGIAEVDAAADDVAESDDAAGIAAEVGGRDCSGVATHRTSASAIAKVFLCNATYKMQGCGVHKK